MGNSIDPRMEKLKNFYDFHLFEMGGTAFTPAKIAILILLVAGLVILTRFLFRSVTKRALARNYDPGVVQAVATVGQYVALSVGLLVVVQTVGIDLSGLVVVLGTLGIGIGLALQPLLTNFISGLVLLVERSIRVGDRIEVGTLSGDITRISVRSTTVVTNDNIAVIVPNGILASSQIVNWSYTDKTVRFRIPVSVSYESKADEVRATLLDVAANHVGVLKAPPPDVLFDSFGDSALNFELRIWTREYTSRPGALRSELNFAILDAFRERGIQIPFPQRDIHIRSTNQDSA